MKDRNLLLAAGLIVASEFVLATSGVVIKVSAHALPFEMMVFFRNLFGLLALTPLLIRKDFPGVRTQKPLLHIFRACVGLSAMYCMFFAISNLPLAEAMTLKTAAPIFVPWVAWFWLRERLSANAVWAVCLGFVGVLFLLKPFSAQLNWIAIIGFLGAAFASMAKVAVRKLSATEPVVRIVFYFAVTASTISAIPLLWSWQTPNTTQWLMLIAIGALSTIAQLLLTRGFSLAPAGQIAVFGYTSVLFGAGYGWLLFSESWDTLAILGAIIIITAGLLVVGRQTRQVVTPEQH